MMSNLFKNVFGLVKELLRRKISWTYISDQAINSNINLNTRLYSPYHLNDVSIAYGSYVSKNSTISQTTIGKFCSIGPNFLCGWGVHPTKALSTSPMFYSLDMQNGMSLTKSPKIEERKHITIGNDVFIGANVVVLDGVSIGDGAIIAAGAVVTADVPAYAITAGIPAKVVKYRFLPEQIHKLLEIKWWDWPVEELHNVEELFFDVDVFIDKYYSQNG